MLFTEVETELRKQMEVVKAARELSTVGRGAGSRDNPRRAVVRHVCRRTSH